MSWSSFDPTSWTSGVTIPQVSDYQGIYNDLRTRGGAVDGGGYGRANTSYMVLLPGELPGTQHNVTGASWASGSATLTVGGHSIQVNQRVSISGIAPSGYNTTTDSVKVTAVTSTSISYALGSNPGTYTSGGTVLVDGVSPAYGMCAVDPNLNFKVWNGSGWVAATTAASAPVWWAGSGAPANTLGSNGDFYLDYASGNVYGPKASGAWGSSICNMKGATGATGATGYSPQWIVAAGAPSGSTGNNGDMYINSTTQDVYGPKASGAWGSIVDNIKGASGPQGPTGNTGYSAVWDSGAGAPSGSTGNNGDMYVNTSTGDVYGPKASGAWGSIVMNIAGTGTNASSLTVGTLPAARLPALGYFTGNLYVGESGANTGVYTYAGSTGSNNAVLEVAAGSGTYLQVGGELCDLNVGVTSGAWARGFRVTQTLANSQVAVFGALGSNTTTLSYAYFGVHTPSSSDGAGYSSSTIMKIDGSGNTTLPATLTVNGSGPHTFSGALRLGGGITLGGTNAGATQVTQIGSGSSPVSSRLTFGTDGTGWQFRIGKDQAGTITDYFQITDSGGVSFLSGTTVSLPSSGITFSDGSVQKNAKQNYTYPQAGSQTWIKLGTWLAGATPSSLKITVLNGAGYNTASAQITEAEIYLRTGNQGTAPNLSDVFAFTKGYFTVSQVKVAATGGSTSASNMSWDVYIQTDNGGYRGGIYTIDLQPGDSWTNIATTGATDPGSGSSTVVVGSVINWIDLRGNIYAGNVIATGGYTSQVRSVTANDTATTSDSTVLLNGTGLTETLPASPTAGQELTVINLAASANSIAGNGHNIWSGGTSAGTLSLAAGVSAVLQYDSANSIWRAITPQTGGATYTAGTLSVTSSQSWTPAYNDTLIEVSAASGAVTLTLPSAASWPNYKATVKKTDSTANAVTLGGQTVDGVSNKSWSTQYEAFTLWSDGTNWNIA